MMKTSALLFTATAVLLAACGGSDKGGNAAVDNPSDFPPRRVLYAAPVSPDAAEQQKISANKEYIARYVLFDGVSPTSQSFYVDGQRVFAHMHTGDGAAAHVNAHSLPQGFADRSMSSDVNGVRTRQNVRSYQGLRSGIMLLHNDSNGARFSAPFGYETPIVQLPNAGKATYSGIAFDRHERGQVNYHVDFAARSGHGEITGLNRFGTITLHQAAYAPHYDEINRKTQYRNVGDASASKGAALRYHTRLYGDRAEEVVGELLGAGNVLGFHGTRGEIVE